MPIKPKKNPVTKLIGAGAKAIVKARSPKLDKLAKNYDNALKARNGKAPESKIEKRAIKAANKPTNKTGSKADRRDRQTFQGNSNLIKNADPARPNRVRGGSLGAMKAYGGFGVATAKRSPKQVEWQKEVSKELNPVRKKK
jgi:hypothetical protein